MANKNKITILNEKEKELLRKTNSVIAYDIYFHLKDDDSYFKGEFYDLKRCIADYLNIPERTVKDVLKRLKDVGLVQTRKQGKVNLYTLPYNKKFSIRGNKEIKEIDDYGRKEATDVQAEQPKEQECITVHTEPIISSTYEDVEQQCRKEDNIEETEQPNEQVDKGKFYTLFIAPSIEYWIHLYNSKNEKALKNEMEQKAKYISSLYPNINKDECYDKLFSYITVKQIS